MNITEETRTFRGKTINVMFIENGLLHTYGVSCKVKLKIDDLELVAYGYGSYDSPTKERAYAKAIENLQCLLESDAAGDTTQYCEKECQRLNERLKKVKRDQQMAKWFLEYTKDQ